MTSTTRMFFAFSRDGAMPGAKHFAKLNASRVPANAVIAAAIIALILTLPALIKVDIGGAPVPVAFFAVVSIGVIGLYLAFAIPIFLRWRHGLDASSPASWTNGVEVQVDEPDRRRRDRHHVDRRAAPDRRASGIWWNDGFAWKYVNYAIIVVPVALILLTIYWHVSVKHWFTGPKHTIDPDVVAAFDDRIS